MAEESEDGQEKTEEPSQRRLEKAREDGKVLSSKEMPVFTTLSAGLLLYWALSWSAKVLFLNGVRFLQLTAKPD